MATVNLGRIKPVFRGAYSGSTAYVIDDIVTSGGSSYICIQAHGAGTQAVTVTAYWSVLASTGTDVGATVTTQGDILYRDGSGLQRLAKGTAAQHLLMNSGATAPEWATVAAATSELTHLKTISASNVASVEFVDGASGVVFDGTYREYLLKVTNYWANGSGSSIECQITNDAGSTYETSGYNLTMERAYYSGVSGGNASVKTDCIWGVNFGPATVGTGAMCSFEITFSKPTLTTFPDAKGFFWGAEAVQALLGMAHGRYEVSAAYDGFKIYQESGGNFTARFDLYGIKEN